MENKTWQNKLIDIMFSKYSLISVIMVVLAGFALFLKFLNIDIQPLISEAPKETLLLIFEMFVLIMVLIISNNLKYLKDTLVTQHTDMLDRLKTIDNNAYTENFNNIKNTIKELIDNNNITSKDLKEVLKSVIFLTNTTRNIPSKNDLKLLFPLRNMVLFQELTDTMFEYISKSKTDMDAATLEINLKIIRQSIKSSILNYKTEIYLLSKQTLSNIIEPVLDDKLKEIESYSYEIIKDTTKSIESKYYALSALINDFDSEYTQILLNNLLLTNFIPGEN